MVALTTLLEALQGLANAAEPLPGWITGGQPTEQHLAAFKAAGGEAVLDNRDPMEDRGIDEPDAARRAGLEYFNLPVVHGATTVETMRAMHALLRRLAGRNVLMHCNSGNRTAAGLIPYLMFDREMSEENATDLAMRVGLRSAELLEVALRYVSDGAS